MLCKHDPDCPICRHERKKINPLQSAFVLIFIMFLSVALVIGVLSCLKL